MKQIKQFARENRSNQTKSESIFWNLIVRKKKLKYRFLRQKVIGVYIADFYCPKLKLLVEIDGSSHDLKEDEDLYRDKTMKELKIKTIRYSNEQVEHQLEGVYFDLLNKIEIREKELLKSK